MKSIVFVFALILAGPIWANLNLAPPDFDSEFGRAIFVDFKKAEYEVSFDIKKKKTSVKTRITFTATKTGRPIFDLVPEPRNLVLNGSDVTQRLITTPGKETKLRLVNAEVNPGEHVLEMENTFSRNVSYNDNFETVSSAFWIRDLRERMFMEQYIPSNFEYDQYQMIMDVKLIGGLGRQDIYTNGEITKISNYHYRIVYPEYYTVSCPYFHMTPEKSMNRRDFTYTSISGREIPITVYSPWGFRTRAFKAEAIKIMAELEADYGPWSHPSLVAYGTMPGTGGMEHAGATATSLAALDHEMLHSYFAKGVMPANGNSGWIDEAIASWRDRGYQRNPTIDFTGSDIGAHSVYQRNTDSRSYVYGAAFMAYLDWRLQDVGGLKAFLRGYHSSYKQQVVTTEHFKNNLEFFSGINFDEEFHTYIWGINSPNEEIIPGENPHHKHLTDKQLRDLL